MHPSGRWQRAPDDERVDAALLHADDPRRVRRWPTRATSPPSRRSGGSWRPTGSCTGSGTTAGRCTRPRARSCSAASGWRWSSTRAGNPVAAAHWFERNRGACGPAALYTEEYDVHQRQLRGNLPQAFVHAALLECAVTLSRDIPLGTA